MWSFLAKEHWQPMSKGGGYTVGNILPMCHAKPGVPAGKPCCNNSKGTKDPELWLIEQFGKRKAKAILKRIADYFEWAKAQEEQPIE